MSMKTRRESELLMELSSATEKAAEYRQAIPILKNAGLEQASKLMAELFRLADITVHKINRELERRHCGLQIIK